MNLLALDTSSAACSVAMSIGDRLIERHEVRPREHTRLLLPMIRELLQETGALLSDLDAIVLGNGPGSFIGVRIAASVAQGLAHAAGLNIIPVSSLAAVAAEVFAQSAVSEVAVAQDAHMNEVYLGLYARGEDGVPLALSGERLHGQEVIAELDTVAAPGRIAAGCGWERYPGLLAANSRRFGAQSEILYPRAKSMLSLAKAAGAVSPQDIEPAYLRQKVAEKPLPAGP